MNTVDFWGEVVSDITVDVAESGIKYATFLFKTRRSGRLNIYDTFKITAYKKAAENVEKRLHKGDFAVIECYVTAEFWQQKNGIKRSTVVFILNRVNFDRDYFIQRYGEEKAEDGEIIGKKTRAKRRHDFDIDVSMFEEDEYYEPEPEE